MNQLRYEIDCNLTSWHGDFEREIKATAPGIDLAGSPYYAQGRFDNIRDEYRSRAVDAILDAVIAALPPDRDAYRDGSNLTYEIFGYNSALSEVKAILEAARKQNK